MSLLTGGQDITMVCRAQGKCGLHHLSNEGQVLVSVLDFFSNYMPQFSRLEGSVPLGKLGKKVTSARLGLLMLECDGSPASFRSRFLQARMFGYKSLGNHSNIFITWVSLKTIYSRCKLFKNVVLYVSCQPKVFVVPLIFGISTLKFQFNIKCKCGNWKRMWRPPAEAFWRWRIWK